ncbi:hypothetical protein [Candidatus Methanoplasma termitum]|uniref:hypothetical protein n=1 Tax=Candidatus Methanoplasma termitum TaxID=1577791 RepID=UPI0011DD2709|nr:hypothetical protein [Candidatus Methanoplasma termitum]
MRQGIQARIASAPAAWDGVAGYGNGDAIVVRFDGSGTVKWAKNFGGADYDRFRSVAATSDGGFIAAGLSYEGSFGTGSWDGVPGYGSYDSIAVKYDKNGALEWAKNFGGVGDEGFNSIAATSDGGFIVVGYSSEDSFGTGDWVDVTGYGDYDATIIKCDGSGTVEWLTNFGGGSYEYFYAVTVISDGGLVAAGYSYEDSFGTGNWEGVEGHGYFDGMVVKYKGLDPIAPGVKNNYINASSDSNSTITPSGVVTVQRFNDQTFHFSAADGYVVSSVTVDGRLLTQEQIDSGSYTFTNVMMNHIIDVKSSVAASVTLTIDITEGKGYAKYSTDGLSFLDYTSPVILAYGTELFVVPVPEDGYTFSTWKVSTEAHPDEVTAEPNLHFDSVTGNTHLTLYFEIGSGGTAASDSGIGWYVLGIVVLLIIAGILLWFFLFYRRYYDVLKNESLNIAGADRVHRKSEYRFKVEGYSGTIVYRIGDKEDVVWKTILPNADGSFVIPKEEITGDVTIEPR